MVVLSVTESNVTAVSELNETLSLIVTDLSVIELDKNYTGIFRVYFVIEVRAVNFKEP